MITPNPNDPAQMQQMLALYKAKLALQKKELEYYKSGDDFLGNYVKLLLEINKIKEKVLKTDENSHDIFKQMQNALRNYNKDLESSKGISEQIKRNKELTAKAVKEQSRLQSTLNANELKEIDSIEKVKSKLFKAEKHLEEELEKNIADRNTAKIEGIKKQITLKKEELEAKLKGLSLDARTSYFLQQQIEAMNALLAADEKSLALANKKELKEKSINALKRLTGVSDVSLTTVLINAFTKLDKAQTDFQRQTGKTVEYTKAIAATFSTGMISMSDYIMTASELTRQLGSNAQAIFSPETIKEASLLTNAMGLAVDESNNLAILSKTARVEMDKQDDAIIRSVDNFNKQNKTAFTGAQIMKDVAKTSAATTVSLGSSADKIAKANLEARKLGLTLEQVDRIAESLLNFEQSISNELEAELLTGQNINLETARLLALNNDLEGVSKELGKNQALLNSYINGNRIQQESIAKSMGMSREEMGKMIMNQKTQLGLTDEQVRKASGLSKDDFRRLTLQENINKSIEKMGEALAVPLEQLARMVNFLNHFYGIWVLIGGVALFKATSGILNMINLTKQLREAEAGAAIAKGWGSALTFGIAGIALGAVITGLIMSSMNKAKNMGDGIFPKDGRPKVVSKEGELFQGTVNDEVAVGPGIAKLATTKSSSATVIANNNAELINKMDEFIKKQDQGNDVLRGIHKNQPKEFAVNLETTKFGTAVNTTSYKTK